MKLKVPYQRAFSHTSYELLPAGIGLVEYPLVPTLSMFLKLTRLPEVPRTVRVPAGAPLVCSQLKLAAIVVSPYIKDSHCTVLQQKYTILGSGVGNFESELPWVAHGRRPRWYGYLRPHSYRSARSDSA